MARAGTRPRQDQQIQIKLVTCALTTRSRWLIVWSCGCNRKKRTSSHLILSCLINSRFNPRSTFALPLFRLRYLYFIIILSLPYFRLTWFYFRFTLLLSYLDLTFVLSSVLLLQYLASRESPNGQWDFNREGQKVSSSPLPFFSPFSRSDRVASSTCQSRCRTHERVVIVTCGIPTSVVGCGERECATHCVHAYISGVSYCRRERERGGRGERERKEERESTRISSAPRISFFVERKDMKRRARETLCFMTKVKIVWRKIFGHLSHKTNKRVGRKNCESEFTGK